MGSPLGPGFPLGLVGLRAEGEIRPQRARFPDSAPALLFPQLPGPSSTRLLTSGSAASK